MTPTPHHYLYYYLWTAPHVLQAVLVVAMARRGLHRQFPMFFIYTVFEALQCAVLVGVSQFISSFGPVYLQVYAVGLAVSTAIRFGVIHELFSNFFRSYPALQQPGRFLFRGTTILLLLMAVALAVLAPGGNADRIAQATAFSSLQHTILGLDRAVTVLQCGLLLSLFLFSRYFVLEWRSGAFGIALGLGVFASVELATSAMGVYLKQWDRIFDLANMAVYHLCVLLWMFYLMLPERQPQTVIRLPEHDLEVWNQELQRLLQQ